MIGVVTALKHWHIVLLMGTQNCHYVPPVLNNRCNMHIGDYQYLENFCTFSGPVGDQKRGHACNSMGSNYNGQRTYGKCHYNDCHDSWKMGAGCCKDQPACCGINGVGVQCRRVDFSGDPLRCCLANSKCKSWDTNADCEDGQGHTCSDGYHGAPDYRTLTGKDCRSVMWDNLAGEAIPIDALIGRWMDKTSKGASYFIERVIHRNANCVMGLDPKDYSLDAEGLVYGTELITAFVMKFNREMMPLYIPSTKWSLTYHPVQDVLYDLAIKYPALVDGMLYALCANFTITEAMESRELGRWCGCHLSRARYKKESSKYGLQKECSSACAREGTIPTIQGDGQPKLCKQSVCIVNDVSLRAVRSSQIDITQMCSHCKSTDSCRCVVNGLDTLLVDSKIEGSLKLVKELCSDVLCTIADPDNSNKTLTVPCNGPSILYYQYQKTLRDKEQRQTSLLLTAMVLVVALLVTMFVVRRYW